MKKLSFLENAKVNSKELTFYNYENREKIKVNQYITENGKYVIPINFDLSNLKEYKGYKFVDKVGKQKNQLLQKIYLFAIEKHENRVKLYQSLSNDSFHKVLRDGMDIFNYSINKKHFQNVYSITKNDIIHVLKTLPKKYNYI